ncbi:MULTISPECIES: hypothetical protein [Bacillus amyloliquefaciens group]|uniref:defense against restriction DarA-related protein n=1 Tax=Bacillus amyloliquefaciens group TaxID=1938374 RepID=UPI000A752689|nr:MULTISPECIES: hypothetical protein [Bacillus amyloliquefaciens group]
MSCKVEITGEGQWRKGIGRYFILQYQVETTKRDEEVEEIHFSNIIQHNCKTIEEVFNVVNRWQSLGWKNISVTAQVVDRKGDVVIEESVSGIDWLENEQVSATRWELKETVQGQEKELNLYRNFIKQYNSEKLFDEFKRGQGTLYWYEYRLRGFSLGCQPGGHIKVDHNRGRFGAVAYSKPLTEQQLRDYELLPISGN